MDVPARFSDEYEKMEIESDKVRMFLENNTEYLIGGIIFLVVLGIFFIIIGAIARGGLIRAINQLIKKELADFRENWKEGKNFFWRILGIGLILNFLIFAAIIVLIVPVAFLFYNHSFVSGALMATLAVLIIIPLLVFIYFTKVYANIYTVLGDLKMKFSLENACNLFQKNLKSSLIMGLLLLGINLAVGMAIAAAFVMMFVVFLLLGLLFNFIIGKVGIYLTIALGVLVFLVILFFIQSVYQVFLQTVWILFFREIAMPKAEEKVEETVSEAPAIIPAAPTAGPVKGIGADSNIG